jgi:hypothetical protein
VVSAAALYIMQVPLHVAAPSMLNASNLSSHLAPGPQDRYYRPVNVLTHGKLPPEIVGSNLSNSTTVTTTTTTSKQKNKTS